MAYQPNSRLTAKELAYISDSLNNEDLLAKLCVQAASECQDRELKQVISNLAFERLGHYEELMRTLQSAQAVH